MTSPTSVFLAQAVAFVFATAVLAAQSTPEVIPPGVPAVVAPPENPMSAEKALLGKVLFWDEQLSASGTVACGTCHRPEAGGGDPRTSNVSTSTHPGLDGVKGTADDTLGSPGVIRQSSSGAYEPAPVFGLERQVTPRRAPTVVNSAFATRLFWDGRAEGALFDPVSGSLLAPTGVALEIQAAEPPVSAIEMAHTQENWSAIATRVEGATPLRLASNLPPELALFVSGRSYGDLFTQAFGSADVSPQRILFALATYQRTLVSDQSRWDDFLAGNTSALTELELVGRDVFFGPGKCSTCHGGQLLSDDGFHDIGIRPDAEDLGRGAITGIPEDNGRFRTPSLRNVELRAPYFHTGRFDSLGAVVSFYDDGGHYEADELIERLRLSPSQRFALVTFLKTFTDPRLATGAPPFDRPTLFTESTNVPRSAGAASGAGNMLPATIAIEPAATDRAEFSIGLRNATPGAIGVLAVDFAPAATPFEILGISFHLGLTSGLSCVPIGPLAVSTTGEAFGTWSLNLAAAGVPLGFSFWTQWLVLDVATAHGLTASDATHITTF